MAESMTCYACDREPVQQCPRCGRPYCEEHGEDVCAVCLHPSSGVPSFNLYRGSLLALLVGASLALYLIIQPTGGDTESAAGPTIITPTPVDVTSLTPTAALTPELTPDEGTQPAGGEPAATATTPPAAGGGGEYTVQSGDTLSSICTNVAPQLAVDECVTEIQQLNGLTSDIINVGDVLQVP